MGGVAGSGLSRMEARLPGREKKEEQREREREREGHRKGEGETIVLKGEGK